MLLQAGPITVWYESGSLRYINYGTSELLRMMYFALRDENWNTIDAAIQNEDIRVQTNNFSIHYDCYHKKNDITIYHWKVAIAGDATGKITFEIAGHALTAFFKNRLGFCVLHPLGNYDEGAIKITHSNGSVTQTQFPEYIATGKPFEDISSFTWQNGPIPYNISFEGDVFETEDQRNWADASFKTYCTPLSLPFPVKVNPQDRCYQKIIFTPETEQHILIPLSGKPITITVQNDTFPLPVIGVGASDEIKQLSETAITLLQALKLDHYAIDVNPTDGNWSLDFIKANQQANALKLPLFIKLHLSDDFIKEMADFIALFAQQTLNIKAIVLLSKGQLVTGQNLINYIGKIKEILPEILIGAGTDFNFTEINQYRFDANDVQFISYSSHPQEHAFDNLTLIENIATVTETVKSTQKIYGDDIPVYISPITLKKRFNPYATNLAHVVKSGAERCDERQALSFCALFTLGSIKSLAISNTAGVTLFQTVGKQGIISATDEPHPVYEALKLIFSTEIKYITDTVSSAPLVVDSLLLGNNKLLLWNYTGKDQPVLLLNGLNVNIAAHQVLILDLPI